MTLEELKKNIERHKGERLDVGMFNNEQDAYEHLWNKLTYQHDLFSGIS